MAIIFFVLSLEKKWLERICLWTLEKLNQLWTVLVLQRYKDAVNYERVHLCMCARQRFGVDILHSQAHAVSAQTVYSVLRLVRFEHFSSTLCVHFACYRIIRAHIHNDVIWLTRCLCVFLNDAQSPLCFCVNTCKLWRQCLALCVAMVISLFKSFIDIWLP